MNEDIRRVTHVQNIRYDKAAERLYIIDQTLLPNEEREIELRMCPTPELAEEAAQEAFLAAWQGLPFFRGDSAFATWLYRLTSNACVDLLRKENRHQGPSLDDETVSAEVPDPTPTPEKAVEQQELRRQIEAGLQTLSPEHREVLILREIQQLSYDEIADVLSLDLGTVKSRINRGRRQLREFLLKQGNFLSSAASNKTERGL